MGAAVGGNLLRAARGGLKVPAFKVQFGHPDVVKMLGAFVLESEISEFAWRRLVVRASTGHVLKDS